MVIVTIIILNMSAITGFYKPDKLGILSMNHRSAKKFDTGKISKNQQFPLFYHNIVLDGKFPI